MSDELYYVPGGDDTFVELSTSEGGKLFRKHILTKGPLYYGNKTITIDDDFLDSVVRNFNEHVVSHVQAPVVDENNRHSEDPLRNIGEVVKVEREGDKLYSYIEVRDPVAAPKMGKTLLGASAMLSLNWKNNKTNKHVGPTLIHTAITNNAHLNDLEDFEEVLAMSSVSDSNNNRAVVLSAVQKPKESVMDLDEMIAKLRDEHGIDVPALQRTAAEAETIAKLSADLQDALTETGVLKLSAGSESTAEDIVAAVCRAARPAGQRSQPGRAAPAQGIAILAAPAGRPAARGCPSRRRATRGRAQRAGGLPGRGAQERPGPGPTLRPAGRPGRPRRHLPPDCR